MTNDWPVYENGGKDNRQKVAISSGSTAFVSALSQGGPAPIPFDEIIEVTRTTTDIAHHLAG